MNFTNRSLFYDEIYQYRLGMADSNFVVTASGHNTQYKASISRLSR
jgi:hypothetical protein